MQAASAAATSERAACEARHAAACAAAAAVGAPAPLRGPAADSPLGERFLDINALVSASGFALDVRPARYLCGLTFRLGARRADGSLDRGGFLGGTADMIDCALQRQAPWLQAARAAPREDAQLLGPSPIARTTSLIRAAAAGDERRVRELLAAGAPLRCVDGLRWSALHHASFQGSARTVAVLLEADVEGATVDVQTSIGTSPLIEASMNGHEGAVCALLARGARQELRNKFGATALHHAAEYGSANIIKLLHAAPGAQVDARDNTGVTPLAYASCSGREDAVRTLLACGARQELQNKDGMAALHFAAQDGHTGVVELLCSAPGAAAALALRDSDGQTALHLAACGGHVDVVEQLCAVPGAADALALRTTRGDTPLALALRAGHAACAAVLRARGAAE